MTRTLDGAGPDPGRAYTTGLTVQLDHGLAHEQNVHYHKSTHKSLSGLDANMTHIEKTLNRMNKNITKYGSDLEELKVKVDEIKERCDNCCNEKCEILSIGVDGVSMQLPSCVLEAKNPWKTGGAFSLVAAVLSFFSKVTDAVFNFIQRIVAQIFGQVVFWASVVLGRLRRWVGGYMWFLIRKIFITCEWNRLLTVSSSSLRFVDSAQRAAVRRRSPSFALLMRGECRISGLAELCFRSMLLHLDAG
jgi:hypothetical protein